MKFNKKMFLNTLILLFIFAYLLAVPGVAKSQEFGAILIAHGSSIHPDWNQRILDLREDIKLEMPSTPVEVSFLHFDNGRKLADVIKKLKKDHSNIKKVLLVHLSPSSYSIRHEEIDKKASKYNETHPFKQLKYGIVAMDDHPKAVEILKDHAEEFYENTSSRSPENESLILLGYGPAEELENIVWVRQLERIGESIRAELGFKEVACMTLRHHSADLIRSQAITDLQRTAKRLKEQGRVIVVPYVLYILPEGSFQRELQSYLRGIIGSEDICTKGVISNNNTKAKEWVKKVINDAQNDIQNGKDLPGVKSVNRNWSAMDRAMIGDDKYKYGRVKIEKKPK